MHIWICRYGREPAPGKPVPSLPTVEAMGSPMDFKRVGRMDVTQLCHG